jgi:hypothetical protein
MDKIDKRRLTEKNLYQKVDDGLIVRRNPLTKQQKVKLSSQEYTFLQFHHIIWKWALANHGLNNPELGALLYISPLVTFTMKEFFDAQEEMGSTSPNVFFSLKKKNYIATWSKVGRTTYYVVTTKGNTLVNRMHKMYMLEEEIPTSSRRNVIGRSKKPKDVMMMKLFKKFNEKVKDEGGKD